MGRPFRNYTECDNQVETTYRLMLENQTLGYVREMKDKYEQLNISESIWDTMQRLNEVKDESDPDNALPQSVHAYQTAEAASSFTGEFPVEKLFSESEWALLPKIWRDEYQGKTMQTMYPSIDLDWLPLVGLIHDSGKVLLLREYGALPQWSVVGDTFPVGEPLDPGYVFYEKGYHLGNDSLVATSSYENNCGFNKVTFSFGHDEYLASVLEKNKTKLPKEAIYLVRHHSFYAWHTPRVDKRGYTHLANDYDWYMLPLLKALQQSDLYSKLPTKPDFDAVKDKFKDLVEHYFENSTLFY
jgi:inositol oxygenase